MKNLPEEKKKEKKKDSHRETTSVLESFNMELPLSSEKNN